MAASDNLSASPEASTRDGATLARLKGIMSPVGILRECLAVRNSRACLLIVVAVLTGAHPCFAQGSLPPLPSRQATGPDVPGPLPLVPSVANPLPPTPQPLLPAIPRFQFQPTPYLQEPGGEELPAVRSVPPVNNSPAIESPIRPRVLSGPHGDLPTPDFVPLPDFAEEPDMLLQWPVDPPLGYTGPTGIRPLEPQTDSHFVPFVDRWRAGFPAWDRYNKGHPLLDEYPFVEGSKYDPYHQNVLKGDYPILGQHNFFILTASEQLLIEGRQVPTPTTPFESTANPGSEEFYGDPDQYFLNNNLVLSTEWNHGDAGFKPADWRVKLTHVFNMNHLVADELAVVKPDVRAGTGRFRTDYALEEWFVEAKLADIGPDYDFVSAKVGSQFFASDFRGFIFADTNRAARLFGTRFANRDQFNLVFFDQTEKESNSLLNTFDDRHQNTIIANYYRQDFIWPGYTFQLSYHYNHDEASVEFDKNGFLVRPDPVGVFAAHEINSHYLGFSGDGHINRFNISHAFYWALGHDNLNPLAGRPVDINAQMFAIELSYDRDWIRFRTSYFFASGDDDIFDSEATGFETIFDNPNFAGGQFSYWQRQTIKLFGVNLTNRMSLVPDLRSSKFQGQQNFLNPGLHLFNVGMDVEVTPKLRSITNVNFLWFDQTEVLEQFVFQPNIDSRIGADLSTGIEYRPLLNNNIIFVGGISMLIPAAGFNDLYAPITGEANTLVAGFANLALTY